MDRVFSLCADGRTASLMQEDKRTEEQSPPCAGIKRDRGKVISAVLMSHTIYSLPESTGKTVPAQSQKADSAVCCMDQKDENTFLRVHDKTNSPDKRRFPYKKEYVMICHAVLLISRK